jgi:hypothetical protein
MGANGKGKGKSWRGEKADAKTARLTSEIDSCYAHANYLESLQSRHWTKGEWFPGAKGAPKGGKGGGKGGKQQGKGKYEAGYAAKRGKNSRSKSQDRGRSPSRGRKPSRSKSQPRSSSSASKRSSSRKRSESTDYQESAAAKKKTRQADKK